VAAGRNFSAKSGCGLLQWLRFSPGGNDRMPPRNSHDQVSQLNASPSDLQLSDATSIATANPNPKTPMVAAASNGQRRIAVRGAPGPGGSDDAESVMAKNYVLTAVATRVIFGPEQSVFGSRYCNAPHCFAPANDFWSREFD
jgi:hypothetical protein